MLADPLDPHALEQLVVGVVRPALTTRLRGRRQRRAAWQRRHGSYGYDSQNAGTRAATRTSRQSRHPTPPLAGGDPLSSASYGRDDIAPPQGPQSPGTGASGTSSEYFANATSRPPAWPGRKVPGQDPRP